MTFHFLNRVIKHFTKAAKKQEMKGIKKYGHELNPLEHKYDWLEMAEEELVDGYKYLCAERERRDHVLSEILELTKSMVDIEDEGGRLSRYLLIEHKIIELSVNVKIH